MAAAGSVGAAAAAAAATPMAVVDRPGYHAATWPTDVVQLLQQQYIYHTDRPTYDVAMLEEVVLELFGFELQAPDERTTAM
jgi:hypothetical protein